MTSERDKLSKKTTDFIARREVEFFIGEIKKGALANGEALNSAEEEMILLTMPLLDKKGISGERGAEVQNKCIRALNKSFDLFVANIKNNNTKKNYKTLGIKFDKRGILSIWPTYIESMQEYWYGSNTLQTPEELSSFATETMKDVPMLMGILETWVNRAGGSQKMNSAYKGAGCMILITVLGVLLAGVTYSFASFWK